MGHSMLLSVIIPTRNRSKYLSTLLDSLFLQMCGSFAWEIIVIDNGSMDNTAEVVKEKILHGRIPLRYVREPKPGLHHGRHRGAQEALGEIIAFLDDDIVLPREWISGMDLIQCKKADAVVSRILPNYEVPPPSWLTELIVNGRLSYLTLQDLGNEPIKINPLYVWGASFFIRHSLISRLGGFHPDGMPPELLRFRGDGELGFFRKFKQQGFVAWYDPRSVAFHLVTKERMTIDYFCRRAYNEGISDSYTQIREDHALYVDDLMVVDRKKKKSPTYYMQRAREMSFTDWLGSLNNTIQGFRRCLLPSRQEKIAYRLQSARRAGWTFHQSAVKMDPELLAYILKESYLD